MLGLGRVWGASVDRSSLSQLAFYIYLRLLTEDWRRAIHLATKRSRDYECVGQNNASWLTLVCLKRKVVHVAQGSAHLIQTDSGGLGCWSPVSSVCVCVCFHPIYSGHQSTPFGICGHMGVTQDIRRKKVNTSFFLFFNLLLCCVPLIFFARRVRSPPPLVAFHREVRRDKKNPSITENRIHDL